MQFTVLTGGPEMTTSSFMVCLPRLIHNILMLLLFKLDARATRDIVL